MKKLIFIDNDNEQKAKEDLAQIVDRLEYKFKVPDSIVNSIMVIPDFHKLSREDQFNVIFSNENICISYSMFTATHYGSLNQLYRFLAMAGRCQVKGITHIDCSRQMQPALKRNIMDVKVDPICILKGIENNNLITFSDNYTGIERIAVDLQSEDLIVSHPIAIPIEMLLTNGILTK